MTLPVFVDGRKFMATITPDYFAGGYTAAVEELPECSARGTTILQSIDNVREAIASTISEGAA